jgi:lysozyme family protein
MTDARFEACLLPILREEGGNDDDPQDHGGRTSRGVTQREYSPWRVKHGLPDRDVFSASDQEIHDIYYEEYWLPHGPKLHPGVDLVWFNFAVLTGPGEAHRLLMRSIGPDDADNDAQTINRMCNEGEAFFRGLAQFPRYGKGWTARTERIRADALKMQKDFPVATSAPWPPPHPSTPASPSPSGGEVILTTEGHIMIDVTKIEQEVNIALDLAEKLIPWGSMLFGPGAAPVIALLMKAIAAARTIEKQLGIPTTAAVASADAHNTPGAPNSIVLGG